MRFDFDKEQLTDSLRFAASLAELENERTIESLRADQNRDRARAIGAGALLLLAGGGLWFYSDRKHRKERFQKEAAELQTQVLRAQMNPHFIFNALNSINAFVRNNDPKGASFFLSKFAGVMRGVLKNSRHREVA
ncbi:MAG: histidine kinase [Flavobacteriales bacterium]|nr:histidine kinase [Flavobacteriales bacterium]